MTPPAMKPMPKNTAIAQTVAMLNDSTTNPKSTQTMPAARNQPQFPANSRASSMTESVATTVTLPYRTLHSC